jgi:hypothetical protein
MIAKAAVINCYYHSLGPAAYSGRPAVNAPAADTDGSMEQAGEGEELSASSLLLYARQCQEDQRHQQLDLQLSQMPIQRIRRLTFLYASSVLLICGCFASYLLLATGNGGWLVAKPRTTDAMKIYSYSMPTSTGSGSRGSEWRGGGDDVGGGAVEAKG